MGGPRSPGTHIVGPWVTDSIKVYRVLRTGTQHIGNWASRVCFKFKASGFKLRGFGCKVLLLKGLLGNLGYVLRFRVWGLGF